MPKSMKGTAKKVITTKVMKKCKKVITAASKIKKRGEGKRIQATPEKTTIPWAFSGVSVDDSERARRQEEDWRTLDKVFAHGVGPRACAESMIRRIHHLENELARAADVLSTKSKTNKFCIDQGKLVATPRVERVLDGDACVRTYWGGRQAEWENWSKWLSQPEELRPPRPAMPDPEKYQFLCRS